ncbi:BTB/POZ domain-containing protein [Colletotrichum gloeosporioides Cg-14]|uniref:BTB/POZ domain-containing protein n=1 Tax=Colletotrichum gloeosporioides (strain Cg-14) TaxID=1237896 RepID=T0M902_COLGC|nr:BTB/POZ domain-containing protein [Colletotrichum gloeosporioides Cg-14]
MEVDEDHNTIVEIAADGDVIMVVGSEQNEFRLYSLFLKTTSKVFKAMLGPNFAEGQQLIASGNREPIKIDLPQDDVESMEFIFRVIHHQFDALHNPEDFPFFEILVAADKYDLLPAIKYAFHHALAAVVEREQTLEQMCCEDLWKLAMAAAFVTSAPAFKAATRALIFHCDEGYLVYAKEWSLNEVFALQACAALHGERTRWKSLAMSNLLRACQCRTHAGKDEFRYEFVVGSPHDFIYDSLSDQLDLIEACQEYQKGARSADFYDKHWMDETKEDAGLDLDNFV